MSKNVGALLLDTRSIQKYIFMSNKLKTNIGASYLVKKIFDDLVIQTVDEIGLKMPEIAWDSPENKDIQMKQDNSIQCEIVYIGGGKILMLVNKDGEEHLQTAKNIVRKWTKKVLLYAPGLKTGAAIGELDISDEHPDVFVQGLDELTKQLKANQSRIIPIVDIPYSGLTLECDYTGKTADIDDRILKEYYYNMAEGRKISSEVAAKIIACSYSQEELIKRNEVSEILQNKFIFADELENIGYKKAAVGSNLSIDNGVGEPGESYISVVHIDGNNMGAKFSGVETSQEYKELSLAVEHKVRKAFAKLLDSIISEFGKYDGYLDFEKMYDSDGKCTLPIRPIIIGGDDITFICPGRLGITYAERLIKFINEEPLLTKDQQKKMKKKAGCQINDKMSCCAGIAIVTAEYPFFRAYELAEQACSVAKKNSRKDDSSWLEFVILHGESSPELADLREAQYHGVEGNLHYGPYQLEGTKPDSVTGLIKLSRALMVNEIPSSCIKGLRDALTKDAHNMIVFLRTENCKKLRELVKTLKNLKDEKDVTYNHLWENDKSGKSTRYIDAIEIMKFIIPELYEVEEAAQ